MESDDQTNNAEHMDNAARAEDVQPYQPPSDLPPPIQLSAPNPIPAVVLGLVASVILGVALFAASRAVYIYILYNSLVGIGIGKAIAYGVHKGKYANTAGLFGLTVLCSAVSYGVFNYSFFYWVLRDFEGARFSFLEFLRVRAENDTLFGDLEPGLYGNVGVWFLEAGITWYFAFAQATRGVRRLLIELVPAPVTEFVVYLISQKRDRLQIDEELGRRGWMRPGDRDRAVQSATAVLDVIRETKND